MKKTLLLVVVLMTLGTFLAGQSITVTSPGTGATWAIGSTHPITWTSSGVGGPVAIKLRLANAPDAPPVLDIVASTDNDGSYSWTIPSSVAAGSYLVRVRTVSDSPLVYDDGDNFQIVSALPPPPPPLPSLRILEPNGGENWPPNTAHAIRWSAVNVQGKVRLELVYHQGQMLGVIAENLDAASGQYNWQAGKYGNDQNAPSGDDYSYHVRVRSQNDAGIYDQGDQPFSIKRLMILQVPHEAIPLALKKPDLVVCAEAMVVTPLNVPGTLHVYVRNVGKGTAKAPFKVKFSIVAHDSKTVTVNADLPAGETRFVGELSAQGSGVAGFKTWAKVDNDEEVDEKDENNNRFEGWFHCRSVEQGSSGPVTCSDGSTVQ
jgi:hypothetical protein